MNELTDHAALAAGLRELADWYEQHTELPVPAYPNFHHVFIEGHPDNRPETIERIAAALGSTVEVSDNGGHIQTRGKFGPIRYLAAHVPAATMWAHRALMSYADNVQSDTAGGAA